MDVLEIAERYKLIIWDFDGTIVKLHVDWKGLKRKLLGIVTSYNIKIKKNLSLNKLIYLGEQSVSRDIIFKIIERYELKADFSVNEISVRLIEEIHNFEIIQCILSDNMYKTIETILNKLQILDFFDLIISKEFVKRFKPDLEGLRKILRYYSYIDKSHILYIGDNWKDKLIASQEGLNFFEIKGVGKDG